MPITYTISAAALTHRGSARAENQDNLYFTGAYPDIASAQSEPAYNLPKTDGRFVFAVSDGIGGEPNGAQAAFIAVSGISAHHEGLAENYARELDNYIRSANAQVCSIMESGSRGGSTLALVALSADGIHCANVGDTRIYLKRGTEIIQLSEDHNQGGVMRKMNVPNPKNLKGKLTLYLGISPDELRLEAHSAKIPDARPGDRILICSDGLTDMLGNSEISGIIGSYASEAEACSALLDAALERGGKDNITALLINILDIKDTKTSGSVPEQTRPKPAKSKGRSWLLALLTVLLLASIGANLYFILEPRLFSSEPAAPTPAPTSSAPATPATTPEAVLSPSPTAVPTPEPAEVRGYLSCMLAFADETEARDRYYEFEDRLRVFLNDKGFSDPDCLEGRLEYNSIMFTVTPPDGSVELNILSVQLKSELEAFVVENNIFCHISVEEKTPWNTV